ncbi:hypothetical protein C8J57DRAFT_1348823 [Mycena rebaudengoi]|nr:hypothetical protein C8J57DRAFT_1348823 [Mycena rebaudengoi]
MMNKPPCRISDLWKLARPHLWIFARGHLGSILARGCWPRGRGSKRRTTKYPLRMWCAPLGLFSTMPGTRTVRIAGCSPISEQCLGPRWTLAVTKTEEWTLAVTKTTTEGTIGLTAVCWQLMWTETWHTTGPPRTQDAWLKIPCLAQQAPPRRPISFLRMDHRQNSGISELPPFSPGQLSHAVFL